jgi:glycosyltransferase involved in cell wall biosynthesis
VEQKKKIVFYYPDMYVGGVEMAIINLAKRIYKDYNLYFFYHSVVNLELARELAKYGIPMNITSIPENFIFECDILVYCSLWLERDNHQSFIKAKQKFLWSHAMVPPLGGTKFYNLPFVRTLDRMISVSKAADETIPKHIHPKRLANRYYVINNILNVDDIKTKAAEETPQLDLAKDLNIVTVARISHEKGWKRIKVLADMFNKRNIDWRWYIVGEGYVPEQVDEAHALLDEYPQIVFLGKRMNPFPIVKQMDYIALLSDFESWGLAITEGKILGVPPIVSSFPSAFEQVEDDVNGVIVPLNAYGLYDKAVDKIISNKEKYRKALESFDYEENNQQIVTKWKQLFEADRADDIKESGE